MERFNNEPYIALSIFLFVAGAISLHNSIVGGSQKIIDKPETSPKNHLKKVVIQPAVEFTAENSVETEFFWEQKDVSGWSFADGGYFLLENGVILPKNEIVKVPNNYVWKASKNGGATIWTSDKKFVKRHKKKI
tara:strand:- start:544 stop:945 length:402 start_codon:yes stop_codon:yes gene_type:complete